MRSFDLVILGGGMVGLALARALHNSPISIAVIESRELDPQLYALADNRVSAINRASQNFLTNIGAWSQLALSRVQPYHQMQVWEQDSFGELHFNAQQGKLSELGHIIENRNIQLALSQSIAQQANLTLFCPRRVAQLAMGEGEAWLTLDNGQALTAKLVVGADGAQSWLRSHAGIPLTSRDYQHHAIVATVETQASHQQTAWQIFRPDGPLAFLPLFNAHHSSIVWSASPEQAKDLMALDDESFNRQLTMAFDNKLGLTQVLGKRACVPLTMRFARDFAKHRVALVGDAAHTIHPLAGQGVNLGLMDAAALAQTISENLDSGFDIGLYPHLRSYERWRKTQAVEMIAAMEALKQGFSGKHPLQKFVRDIGLKLVDNTPLLKQRLLAHATGLVGELPKLAR
ncbi:FAD-dependent monooxygenase [Motilimonas eburnea]|nr:FAD-dependent monooxygenase [Motilimonas eburnea]MCE2571007.1 FAD-dependent monooxygenase [Motilimonas eburnea]